MGPDDGAGPAGAELTRRGFERVGPSLWRGPLGGAVPVEVTLPDGFPHQLPEVNVRRASLPFRIAHLDECDKLCIAPTSGILLDAGDPAGIVADALARAEGTIARGLSGESRPDLFSEFLAYWDPDCPASFGSICAPTGPGRPIVMGRLTGTPGRPGGWLVASDGPEALRAWADRLGCGVQTVKPGFFLPLTAPFEPPEFGAPLTVRAFMELMRGRVAHADAGALRLRLSKPSLPFVCLLAIPVDRGAGRALVGVRLATPPPGSRRGFRPHRMPIEAGIRLTQGEAVQRCQVTRFDPEYLNSRGGLHDTLSAARVAIVGCGAVGGFLAAQLASAGVGRLRLVDKETLSADNIQRHLLGAASVGAPKVDAIRADLGARFPHVAIETRRKSVEDLLREEPAFLTEADLLVLATGDATLELRLNASLRGQVRTLHVWVEPLGIGGHALLTAGKGATGCFACLFARDPVLGLHNRASFAAPGQAFGRSLAGCGGTFTPFGAADATRAAVEATRLAVEALETGAPPSRLASWYETPTRFVAAGFRLSAYAEKFREGERAVTSAHAGPGCEVCR